MRLTCPNCDAQYEVPDEVIPSEGRDVQCSDCGDTWFQNHADHHDAKSVPEQVDTQIPDPSSEDLRAALQDNPTRTAEASTDNESTPAPVQKRLDSSVKDILRQEAELEAQLRAEESGNTLESQPNLGLDDIPDESERRAREARERINRVRSLEPKAGAQPEATVVVEQTSRSALLPDIEEISSTLRADGDTSPGRTAVRPVSPKRRRQNKGSFTRGVAVAILLVAAMLMVYTRAPQISQSYPLLNPALNSYVAGVQNARLWLDAKIGDLIPQQPQ